MLLSTTPQINLTAISRINWQLLLRPNAVKQLVIALKVLLWITCILLLVELAKEALDSLFSGALQDKINQSFAIPEIALTPDSGSKNYSLITSRNIFGDIALPVTKSTPLPVAPEKPRTTLPLELVGIFIPTNSGEKPSAIVENKKKSEQDVFSVGEMIFGEAKLVSVHSDRIEIERDGQIEVLALDDTAILPVGVEGGVASVSQNEFVVEEAELDKALENLPLLLQQARAVPYFRDGKADGLRLFAIRPESLFAKVGLKNGDILKSINGKSMADPSQALKLFEELKDERSINLVLERNRVSQEFKYQIR